MTRWVISMAVVMCAFVAGCSTAPTSVEGRESLETDAQAALQRMKAADPSLKNFLADGYGYAIFPSVGKGGIGVGGAYGRGVVYEQGRMIGYCDLSQATVGLQLGGQGYSELIVFEHREALDRFTSGRLEFAAQVSAVAVTAGASAAAAFQDGVAVFIASEAGLMYEASIGGQRFTYQPVNMGR